MCDIIWCKEKLPDGSVCNTVNYLDPYNFWNWEGKIQCANCGAVFYIHMIQGFMYKGPEKREGEKPDIMPLYADKPLEGYINFLPGIEGKTRPYHCLPRDIYLGKADMVKFSTRGKPVRGWRPQPPSAGLAGSFTYRWKVEELSPEVWAEYKEKLKRGEVKEW